MARTYTSGTINAGSTVLTSAAVHTAIRAALIANAHWTVIEEITAGGIHSIILKCDTASQGFDTDMYVVLSRTTASGVINVYAGEGYDTSTDVLSPAFPSSGLPGTQAVNAAGLKTATPSVDFTTGMPVTNSPHVTGLFSADAIAFWMVIVDDDHAVMKAGTTSDATYVGAFTSLISGTDANPLLLGELDSAGTGVSSTTAVARIPGAASPAPATAWSVISADQLAISLTTVTPLASNVVDLYNDNKAPVYEQAVVGASNNAATVGYLRGKYKKLVRHTLMPSGTATGDTMTIGGTTWVVVNRTPSASSGILVDTGA